MPANYVTMWGMLILMGFGAIAGPLMHGGLIRSVRAAYPADEAKRAALHRCGEADAEFTRFSEYDRDLCYRAMLRPMGQTASGLMR